MKKLKPTEKELKALDWFRRDFNPRRGKIHTQHRDGLMTLLDKVREMLNVGDTD